MMKTHPHQAAILAAFMLTAGLLSGCASEQAPTRPEIVAANCEMVTRLPRINSDHLLLIRPESAVICDGPAEIPVEAPLALAKLLNRSTPIRDDATYYCPLDDGSRISIVITGTNLKTHKPDGQIVNVSTSGCGFANSITGRWILSSAAWSLLEELDPALREHQEGRVVMTANRRCCAAQTL